MGKEEGRREGSLWSGRLELPGSPVSPEGKSQEEKEAHSFQPQILLDAEFLFGVIGAPMNSRTQKLPDQPGLCLLHGPARDRGVDMEEGEHRGKKSRSANPQVWGVPELLDGCKGEQGQAV